MSRRAVSKESAPRARSWPALRTWADQRPTAAARGSDEGARVHGAEHGNGHSRPGPDGIGYQHTGPHDAVESVVVDIGDDSHHLHPIVPSVSVADALPNHGGVPPKIGGEAGVDDHHARAAG